MAVSTIREFSAGGVVLNLLKKNADIILINRRNSNIWCLPKGKIEEGEKKEQTALREVREETGVFAKIIKRIDKINYRFYKDRNVKCFKTVYFYMMKYKSGDINANSFEVDNVNWFNIDKALLKMNYKSEKEIVKKVKIMLNNN